MADTWKAYTDTQALKELAGLRGIAPSVRFLEKRPQGASKEKIYHVRQNELVYLWGVEMFQGGTDCITIDMINSDGSFTPYKSGGQSITDFISADKMTYNFGLIEYPGFDDFWEDPYLVNYITTDTNQEIKKIVKSNFFRAFVFPNEGYYRIVLNERINPLTGSSGFVANYNDDQYTPLTNYYARSWMGSTLKNPIDSSTSSYGMKGANSANTQSDNPFNNMNDDPTAAPIQAIRTESEFKREIIIKVISSNKDIVDSSTISRRNITFFSGYNYDDSIQADLVNGKTTFGALNVQGNNAHFASRRLFRPLEFGTYAGELNVKYISYTSGSDTAAYGNEGWKALFNRGRDSESPNIKIMNSDLEFLYADSNMEYAPISRDLYVGGKLNNGSTTDNNKRNNTTNNYSSSTTDEDFRRLRIINARNSIIENLNMYSNTFGIRTGEPNFLGPNNWWIYRKTTPGDYDNSGRGYVHRAIIDLSGSIIRNCTFEGMIFNALGVFTDQNSQSFIVDGCTFENCTFKGANLLQGFNGIGILIKNCKFEQIPKNCATSDDLIRFYNTHSVCMMGCSVEHQGRFIEMIANGPFTDNIIIRCFDKRRSGQMQAGEGITIDASNSYPVSGTPDGTWPNVSYSFILNSSGRLAQTQYGSNEGFSGSEKIRTSQFNGNLCLMNNSIMSSGNSISLHGFIAKGKLNLSAFTNHHYDPGHYLFGRKIDSTASNSDSNIWWHYNVYMHNYSFGGCQGIDFRPNAENNRFLNCVFESPGYVGLDYGNFTNPATGDSTPKRFIYQMSGTEGSIGDSSASPTKNLFNNCIIINYNEKMTKESYESFYSYRNEFSSYGDYGLYGQRSVTPVLTTNPVGSIPVKYFKFADDTASRGSYPTSGGGYGWNVGNPTTLSPRQSTIFPNNETDAQLTQRLSGGENVIHNLTKIGERYF